jgi:hypothetical protein
LADDVRLAQVSQSFFVRIRSDAASPIDGAGRLFTAGGTTPGQKGQNNEEQASQFHNGDKNKDRKFAFVLFNL